MSNFRSIECNFDCDARGGLYAAVSMRHTAQVRGRLEWLYRCGEGKGGAWGYAQDSTTAPLTKCCIYQPLQCGQRGIAAACKGSSCQ